MKESHRFLLLLTYTVPFLILPLAAAPVTPKPGSADRAAICNAVRAYLAAGSGPAAEDARRGSRFVIDWIKMNGPYAFLDGVGEEQNGRIAYGDQAVAAWLVKRNGQWTALHVEIRGDVPTPAEAARIRKRLPPDFSFEVMSPFWRDLLSGAGFRAGAEPEASRQTLACLQK